MFPSKSFVRLNVYLKRDFALLRLAGLWAKSLILVAPRAGLPDPSKTNELFWLTHLLVHIEAKGVFGALANVSFPHHGRGPRKLRRATLGAGGRIRNAHRDSARARGRLSRNEPQGQRWPRGARYCRAACHGLVSPGTLSRPNHGASQAGLRPAATLSARRSLASNLATQGSGSMCPISEIRAKHRFE